MNDRIEDNPTYKKFKKDLEGAAALHKIVKFFAFFGLKSKKVTEAFSQLPELQQQFEKLSKTPDKFNDYFAKRGWIAYESINAALMDKCITLADAGNLEDAEIELTSHYSSPELKWPIAWLKAIPAFRLRYHFLRLAYEDTLAERYHSVVLSLLTIMDGAVNDISKSKGFFADNTDLTAWDSMAAHSTGLSVLKEIFSESRKRTSSETIDLPFRNGIVHGRDLGYANKTVAAKCWAALFAIGEWAKSIQDGKKVPAHEEPILSFKENLEQLKSAIKEYSAIKKRSNEVSKKVKAWKPRNLTVGVDIPENGSSEEYEAFTPEKEALTFLENWKRKNFGAIAKQIHRFTKEEINYNTEAGRIRNAFKNKELVNYKILKVVDCVPAISEVFVSTTILSNEQTFEKEIKLRLIYEDNQGSTLILGEPGGSWTFIEDFFYNIQYII
ncbi:MAG: zinc chelation protein SecC [Flaviaesturariibacter sp.]|nr:zinc chelation protein SecC [Flaviaesturariibacter sp.]